MNRLVYILNLAAGCLLAACGTEPVPQPANEAPVFSADIAPIVFRNCSPCHHKGGAGPFPLTSYSEVKKKAKTIAKVVSARFMPPWPADAGYTHFAGEKYLSDEQIALINNWVNAGCPQGDSALTPTAPAYPSGSRYGTPDMVVKMDGPFLIKGDNTDKFLLMKFPYEMSRDTFIRFIEFVPGNRKLVHHINGFLIQYYQPEKKKNVFEGPRSADLQAMDYKAALAELKIGHDDGTTFPMLTPSAVNYLPGVEPQVYPNGIGGFRMYRKGAVFLKDIHYGPTPVDRYDSSYFNIFFSPHPPDRPLFEFQMGTLGKTPIVPPLSIPPGEVKTFTTEYVTPEDWSLVTINPHMHLLGKTFWAYALPPGGDTIPLIRINRWDFRWQYFYTFKKMLKIPAGSLIRVVGVFDNTKDNPMNPFDPPRTIGEREGSMRTTDEMFQFIINYLPYRPGDEHISLETTSSN